MPIFFLFRYTGYQHTRSSTKLGKPHNANPRTLGAVSPLDGRGARNSPSSLRDWNDTLANHCHCTVQVQALVVLYVMLHADCIERLAAMGLLGEASGGTIGDGAYLPQSYQYYMSAPANSPGAW